MLNTLLIGTGAIVGIVVAVVAVVLIIALVGWWIGTSNALIRLRNKVEEAWATIDVFLKKRYDLIPNLVETVKGYAKHESGTLEKVVAARNAAMNAQGVEAKAEAENMLSGTLKSLFALSEAYPDLKANANFIDLQNQLKQIESELANARKYYNATARQINTKMQSFPSNIVAHFMHLSKFSYYEIEEEARQNVKVQF